jgi:cytidylate kinase
VATSSGRAADAERGKSRSSYGAVSQDEPEIGDYQCREGEHANVVFAEAAEQRPRRDSRAHQQHACALQQAHNDQVVVEERLAYGSRRSAHDVRLLALGLENNRARRIDDQLQEDDVDWQQDQRPSKQRTARSR